MKMKKDTQRTKGAEYDFLKVKANAINHVRKDISQLLKKGIITQKVKNN